MKFDVCAVEHDHGCCLCQGRGPGVQTQFVAVCRSKQPSREVLVVGMLFSCTCCRNGQAFRSWLPIFAQELTSC